MLGGAMLLAAGASQRFGEADKRTHKLSGGDSLLHATVAKYLVCFEAVVVVLRENDAELDRALRERFGARAPRVAIAAEAHLGMGHSLAAGIRAVDDWDYAFVALADMPFIEPATLTRLMQIMESADRTAIVQPTFRNKPGHPVGFGHTHFQALTTLGGDAGARSIVKNLPDRVITVPVSDPGVVRDVDQLTDLDS